MPTKQIQRPERSFMSAAVDRYLAKAPRHQRQALDTLRRAVRAAVPDATEVIRTGVPAFRYRNRPLVGIGAARHHVALYIMYGGVLKSHAADLVRYDTSNTVVRFDTTTPVPVGLVRKLVKARAVEIDADGRRTAS